MAAALNGGQLPPEPIACCVVESVAVRKQLVARLYGVRVLHCSVVSEFDRQKEICTNVPAQILVVEAGECRRHRPHETIVAEVDGVVDVHRHDGDGRDGACERVVRQVQERQPGQGGQGARYRAGQMRVS